MPGKRRYDESCPIAHALDLIGERWALLVVRELLIGPKRFTDLRIGLGGISANVLTGRLDELEQGGVIFRSALPPPAACQVYVLTESGQALRPLLAALGDWGLTLPGRAVERPLSPAAAVLMLERLFDAEAAAGFKARIGLNLGTEQFLFRVSKQTLRRPTTHREPDGVLVCEPSTLMALVHGSREFGEIIKAGAAEAIGDIALIRRFVTLFPLRIPPMWPEGVAGR